jgi:hypothetical protein
MPTPRNRHNVAGIMYITEIKYKIQYALIFYEYCQRNGSPQDPPKDFLKEIVVVRTDLNAEHVGKTGQQLLRL